MKILVKISEVSETSWAYSVCISDGFHVIGYGVSYADAEKMARKGVKSAQKFIKSQP